VCFISLDATHRRLRYNSSIAGSTNEDEEEEEEEVVVVVVVVVVTIMIMMMMRRRWWWLHKNSGTPFGDSSFFSYLTSSIYTFVLT
jgi:hypothetical protein